jgi:NADP-reducing hydrogenase subunit HndB
VLQAMQDEVEKQGLGDVVFLRTGCMTYCHSEPTVQITLPGRKPVVFW